MKVFALLGIELYYEATLIQYGTVPEYIKQHNRMEIPETPTDSIVITKVVLK